MAKKWDCRQKEQLTQQCKEAVQSIQDVIDTPPRDRHQIVDFGECALVELRDCLILLLRGEIRPLSEEERANIRAALEKVNIAISLITGVEYPASGIHVQSLEQARAVLEGLVL